MFAIVVVFGGVKYVIGIMCGTSMDALDASLIAIDEGLRRLRPVKFLSQTLTRSLRTALLKNSRNDTAALSEISDLNIRLAQEAAAVVKRLCKRAGVPSAKIAVIGYHGHTLWHAHSHRFLGAKMRSTLQIGDGPTLAALTGIPVVNGFRTKDLVNGGCGAPLVPFAHRVMFGGRRGAKGRRIAVNNLGGISNLTYLSKKKLLGFDTGPGNMLIDSLMRRYYRRAFDENGRVAAAGESDETLVQKFLHHPYFRLRPPKSTGREIFGEGFADEFARLAKRQGLKSADAIATATVFTAATIARAYRDFVLPLGLDEAVFCGGGTRNAFLMGLLANLLPVPVVTSESYGFDPQAVEAISFALLGYLGFTRRVNQIGGLTGSRKSLSLGQISWPD